MSESARLLLERAGARPVLFPRFEGDDARSSRQRPEADGGSREAPPAAAATPASSLDGLPERSRAEGMQVGLAQGKAQAFAEWSDRLGQATAALEAAAQALLARRIELAADVERRLPALVFTLARKVLRHELERADTALRTVVRAVTERLSGCDRPVALRVSPELAGMLGAARPSAGDGAVGPWPIAIEADRELDRGDWILETHDGFLDGRVESQLETAWKLVTELE